MTAVVAWLALVVSCLALGWQVLAFSRSGPRVWTWIGEGKGHLDDDSEGHYYLIGIVNIGRQAVTVNEVGIRAVIDRRSRCIYEVGQKVTPKKLEPGEELEIEIARDKCFFPSITQENCDRATLYAAASVWGKWFPDVSPIHKRWLRYVRARLRRSAVGIPFTGK
jgi:hypothetical protein